MAEEKEIIVLDVPKDSKPFGRPTLLDKVPKECIDLLQTQSIVTLGLSGGKDSMACAEILLELNVDFIPIHFFVYPDLKFVDEHLDRLQDRYKKEIVKFPHPMLYDFLRHQDFMASDDIQYFSELDIPKMTFEMMIGLHLEEIGLPQNTLDVVGMRACESMNRRKYHEKYGFHNKEKNKVFPIYNWNKNEVLTYLDSKKVELPIDYSLWNRSYDGMKYQFLYKLEKNIPDDYNRILELFPLLHIENKRYEFNRRYFQ